MFVRIWFSVLILFATTAHAQTDITIFTNLTDWQDATELVVTEGFEDDTLVSNLGVTTDNGEVDIANALWSDNVTSQTLGILGAPAATTTWTYNNAPTAWSTDIDLSPGGAGSGLDITVTYSDGAVEDLGTVSTSGFLGIVSNDTTISIASIEMSTSALVGSQEQFNLDNFASGFAATVSVPEPSTLTLLSLTSVLLMAKRRRLA